MKIVIAGGTGFVGKVLSRLLQENGHEIIILTRNKTVQEKDIQYVQWLQQGARPEQLLDTVDAFVNLAGISLNNGRWTKKQKKKPFIQVVWMLHLKS